MLTEKQQEFLDFIIKTYKEQKEIPTIGLLKKKSHYKSYNTIYKYLNILSQKEIIKYNQETKKITYINASIEDDIFLNIPIINEKKYLQIKNTYLDNKEYYAYQVHDNRLKSFNILSKDILIIEKSQKNFLNKLVLVSIDDKYLVLKYLKKDGYIHLLNDKESYVLADDSNILGKVISLIRPTMD